MGNTWSQIMVYGFILSTIMVYSAAICVYLTGVEGLSPRKLHGWKAYIGWHQFSLIALSYGLPLLIDAQYEPPFWTRGFSRFACDIYDFPVLGSLLCQDNIWLSCAVSSHLLYQSTAGVSVTLYPKAVRAHQALNLSLKKLLLSTQMPFPNYVFKEQKGLTATYMTHTVFKALGSCSQLFACLVTAAQGKHRRNSLYPFGWCILLPPPALLGGLIAWQHSHSLSQEWSCILELFKWLSLRDAIDDNCVSP